MSLENLELPSKGTNDTFQATLNAISNIPKIIDDNFFAIIELILKTKGKTIITGMGKSGIIGKKISATLASTGTPSFFIHPGEAIHGDLGMFESTDIVIAISHSGNTKELIDILPILQDIIKVKVICIVGNINSLLYEKSDYKIVYNINSNEGYLNLPPMSSTTSQLIIGDLIASALMEKRDFKDKNFAIFHPGGSLGKQLLLKIENLMSYNDEVLKNIFVDFNSNLNLEEVILKMNMSKKGGVVIVDENKQLKGIFTDGDFRKFYDKHGFSNGKNTPINEIMTQNPKFIYLNDKPIDALNIMETYSITLLPVVDKDSNQVVGVINIHDLLKEGIK